MRKEGGRRVKWFSEKSVILFCVNVFPIYSFTNELNGFIVKCTYVCYINIYLVSGSFYTGGALG